MRLGACGNAARPPARHRRFHDLDLLAAADHLIDMGPGGGQRDGAVAGRPPGPAGGAPAQCPGVSDGRITMIR